MRWPLTALPPTLALLAACGSLDRSSGGSKAAAPAPTGTATGTGTGPGTGTATGRPPRRDRHDPPRPFPRPRAPPKPVTPVLPSSAASPAAGRQRNARPDVLRDRTALPDRPPADPDQRRHPGPLVLACYGTDPTNVVYTRSTDGGVAKTDTVDQHDPGAGQLTARVRSPALFVVGHSYGGWTAMDVVLKTQTT